MMVVMMPLFAAIDVSGDEDVVGDDDNQHTSFFGNMAAQLAGREGMYLKSRHTLQIEYATPLFFKGPNMRTEGGMYICVCVYIYIYMSQRPIFFRIQL